MKSTLSRFARDFTKLSEYFGPDDYDRNLHSVENINNMISPARGAPSSSIKEKKNTSIQNETKNISKIFIKLDSQIVFDKEVFYDLENEEFESTTSKHFNESSNNSNKAPMTSSYEANNNMILLKTVNNNIHSNPFTQIEMQKPKRSKYYDEAYNSKRNSLPCQRKKINLNVWGILKEAVSKDLSKFCVPGKQIFNNIIISILYFYDLSNL